MDVSSEPGEALIIVRELDPRGWEEGRERLRGWLEIRAQELRGKDGSGGGRSGMTYGAVDPRWRPGRRGAPSRVC